MKSSPDGVWAAAAAADAAVSAPAANAVRANRAAVAKGMGESPGGWWGAAP
jgi:hypothetical protein